MVPMEKQNHFRDTSEITSMPMLTIKDCNRTVISCNRFDETVNLSNLDEYTMVGQLPACFRNDITNQGQYDSNNLLNVLVMLNNIIENHCLLECLESHMCAIVCWLWNCWMRVFKSWGVWMCIRNRHAVSNTMETSSQPA